MTIAACYLSAEGVVLGADSTTTIFDTGDDGPIYSYYDFAQKIFEVGDGRSPSTLGMVMWGLGSLPDTSFRTMVANYAEALRTEKKLPDMAAVAERWSRFFWREYCRAYPAIRRRAIQLNKKKTDGKATEEEQAELDQLTNDYSGGFCLGGNLDHARAPQAYEISYNPWFPTRPQPEPLAVGSAKFWGCPNLIERLQYGIDFGLYDDILKSGLWQGTEADLNSLLAPYVLQQQTLLPLREAIDWVYSAIYSTIKAMKYSQLARVCGGPVEIAVVTSDRPFRWVRHKSLGGAIKENGVLDAS